MIDNRGEVFFGDTLHGHVNRPSRLDNVGFSGPFFKLKGLKSLGYFDEGVT